jgi:hypothetical protein
MKRMKISREVGEKMKDGGYREKKQEWKSKGAGILL